MAFTVLLASSGHRPWVPLNAVSAQGSLLQQRITWPKMSVLVRLRKPSLVERQVVNKVYYVVEAANYLASILCQLCY